jgi:hypothetical protein
VSLTPGLTLAAAVAVLGPLGCSEPPASEPTVAPPGSEDPQDSEAGEDSEPRSDSGSPCEPGTYDAGDEGCLPCPEHTTSEAGATECFVVAVDAPLDARDYGYLYWPGNHWTTWGSYADIQHVQTGFYGLAIDVASASFDHLGLLEGLDREQARLSDNATITDLPTASVRYAVVLDGEELGAEQFLDVEGSTTNPSRLIDMGRFMQRLEIPQVRYAGGDRVGGSIELAAMPRHFVLTQRALPASSTERMTVRIELSGQATSDYPLTEWLDGTRAVAVRNEKGEGWSFILAEGGQIERSEDGGLSFEASFESVEPGEQGALSVTAVPSGAASDEQLSVWLHPGETVTVQFAQLNRDGSQAEELTEARWDSERGLFVVDLRDLSEVGAPASRDWADLDTHTWYNRHRLVVDNTNDSAVSVPIAFDGGGNATFYIVGGSPVLRDEAGEPTGAPQQISKNWHESPSWYHLYSALELPPGQHSFEHTFAHAKWGETYAVAHAQLSLIGWGFNQQWDESSLGAFGESITYDPDFTLGRAMVDDVRPFLVDAAGEWTWTGNVGGANFLVYATEDTDSRPDHQLSRLRTDYAATGPNLTDVSYSGITRDGRVQGTATTQLTRTDDMVRLYVHLRYEFLEDVSYERLALFQVAADRYGDNGFSRYAYGNAAEVLFDESVPNHGTSGYTGDEARGLALTGEDPWVMLYANTHDSGSLPEHQANVGFVVRDYVADLGEESVTTPHINLVQTTNGGWSQMAFELGIPYDPANPVVPAGSVVTATVEYLVPPADKAAWYGDNDILTELPAETFQSPEMMRMLAEGNHLEVEATVGTVLRAHPVELEVAEGVTAADFTLSGGLGYVPVSISGLARPDGWRLEKETEAGWERVDQSVEGNDYWQADTTGEGFELVFNVPNRGTERYRLVR